MPWKFPRRWLRIKKFAGPVRALDPTMALPGMTSTDPSGNPRRRKKDMLKAYLYDSHGKDHEIKIGKILPKLSADKLLWVDVVGTLDGNNVNPKQLVS